MEEASRMVEGTTQRGGIRPAGGGGYRADIDGLRAIAVLAVLCNHTNLKAPGGFVGVDVFFVISGYLISGVILGELRSGRFSLVRFYERRVRRIVPALACVLGVTTVLAWRYMTPMEVVAYAKSLLAAVLSCSNVLFAHQAGYFADGTSMKPLLHTWSLGVEEQFYLVFPLLLMAVWRWGREHLRVVVLGLFGTSLLLAVVWMRIDPVAAFYEAPLRAWELLLGTMAGERYLPLPLGPRGREWGAAAGLAMVLAAIFGYTVATPFPGLTALLPCVGAALLLGTGDGAKPTIVGRLLSLRPLVFVGLISYSLYLWHWPLWVFQRFDLLLVDVPAGNSRLAKYVVVGASLVLATLSWWFVERPFRFGNWKPGRRLMFAMAGVAAVALLAVGAVAIGKQGWPGRFTPTELSLARIASYDPATEVRKGSCFITSEERWQDYPEAVCMPEEHKPKVLLMGDSFAASTYPGLAAEFPELSIWQLTLSNCTFLVDAKLAREGPNGKNCEAMTQWMFDGELTRIGIKHVILAGHWNDVDVDAVGDTVRFLKSKGIEVTLFGPSSDYDQPLGRVLFLEERAHRPLTAGTHWVEAARVRDRRMKELARNVWGVKYVSEFDLLCGTGPGIDPATGCLLLAAPGVPVKFDQFHYSLGGSALFARRLRETYGLP